MGALDNLDSNLSGDSGGSFGSMGLINQVYLGQQGSKEIAMKRSGKKITVPGGDKTMNVSQAQALYLQDQTLRNSWLQTLKKNNVSADPIKARALWDTAVAGASDWYSTSGGTQKVTPEQYIGWYLGGQKKKAPELPSRSIYQYAPEQLAAKIDETAQSLLGRTITDADKSAAWYKNLNSALNEMVMQGTVTTSKKVKNPKTGKMENVVIQKPEVTSESIGQKITSALTEADPISLERKQNLDFANWALNKMRGGR